MNTKRIQFGTILATAGTVIVPLPSPAVVPEVSGVTMVQASDRLVTISYTLSAAPAVVTVDIQTNAVAGVWASIGGEVVRNATGDVWKRVETGTHTVRWHPDLSWPDHQIADGGACAVVTAWALDNTPDYMVVDISAAARPNTQKYYPAVDFLPGGILSNTNYRTTKLLMRKVMAKDVEWTMGSTTLETKRNKKREATHQVMLTNNYYIGVFPVTQAQWDLVQTNRLAPSYFKDPTSRAMRPVEQIAYNELRNTSNYNGAYSAYEWPAEPAQQSFFGILRAKSGLDFDLPSEAQWEFAARAGNGDTMWGDGSGILNSDTDTNLNRLGRYKMNGGFIDGTTSPSQTCGATNGTAIVGTYAPNDWGIYDTAGNVWEWCLDWYEDNIGANDGAVNIDPAAPSNTLSGVSGVSRVIRGGGWPHAADNCRPAARDGNTPSHGHGYGFRVLCTGGLQ